MREAMLLGSRIALLEEGELVSMGTREEFLRSSNPLVKKYLEAFGTTLEFSGKRGDA